MNCGMSASKWRAVVGEHLVAAAHRADRGLEHGAGGVVVIVAGAHPRLLADHAVAAHLRTLPLRVGDDPVAREQPRGDLAAVLDA